MSPLFLISITIVIIIVIIIGTIFITRGDGHTGDGRDIIVRLHSENVPARRTWWRY
jgi:hypothetical protein